MKASGFILSFLYLKRGSKKRERERPRDLPKNLISLSFCYKLKFQLFQYLMS